VDGIIAWWTKNTVAANLLMIACFVAGFIAFTNLERELNPSATFTGASINVAWPGASPREIEEQIVLRVEEAIAGIDGIKHVDSTAREGIASINVEGDNNIDATRFLNEVKNRVDGISTLPQDAFPPIVSQWSNFQPGAFMALYGDIGERELNRLARQLRDELSQLPGGSPLVFLWGAQKEEVSIEVSEEALRRYGLTFDDVSRAIRGSSINLAGGQVRTATGNLQIAARGLADSEEDFERIVVRQNADGSVIRVADVATVIDGFEDRRQIRTLNGQKSISIAVRSPETSDLTKLSKTLNAWVEKKNEELEGKAQIYIWFDAADPFNGQLNLVSSNAVFGLILVLIVLMLFLRPAVAIWVAVGIAVAFAGAFILMPATGVSLNFLSIFGFLLVIGVVVDDAIIVGESIHNQVEDGVKGADASVLGTQLVLKPVFFAVLTTMIAFSPWLFIGGGAAQFTRQISLTIIYALGFSLIEAFLILPAHLSHMKPQNKNGFYYRLQRGFAEGILTFADTVYRRVIKLALRLRYFTVAGFVVSFAVAVALLSQGWVSFKFMPEIQGTFISLNVRLPEGSSFTRTEQIYDEVERAANALKDKLGKADDLDYVQSIYIAADEGEVTSYVTIVDANHRKESTKQVAEMFREELGEIPDAEEINIGFTQNDGGPDLSFGVQADDLEDLRLATVDLQNYLRTLPGAFDVRNNLQSATPELRIALKPGAERFGITLAEVSRQVRQAFYGEEVQRLPREGQDVRVMVRYPKSARESLTTIENMRIRTADGREVPLSAIADAKFAPSYKRIERRDRQRSSRVTAELREGVDRAALMKIYREEFVPEWTRRHPGASLVQRGDAEAQAEFMGEFLSLYVVALFAMYMVLAIAFSSYWQPALIMTAIPFGFMGAAFGHFIFGLDFALFSFFGVGAAAGVVVNDNLVLIDYVNRLRKDGEGAYAALVKAGVGRFRPIVLTSFTTFIGLLPIMFESSTDAQFLKPTIVSLAFGVFFATFVTLIFVPAMYAVGADIARFYRWAWTGEKQAKIGEGASADSDYGDRAGGRGRALDGQSERPNPLWGPAE
jgi:multidrug efflux pump subunit AcrB